MDVPKPRGERNADILAFAISSKLGWVANSSDWKSGSGPLFIF